MKKNRCKEYDKVILIIVELFKQNVLSKEKMDFVSKVQQDCKNDIIRLSLLLQVILETDIYTEEDLKNLKINYQAIFYASITKNINFQNLEVFMKDSKDRNIVKMIIKKLEYKQDLSVTDSRTLQILKQQLKNMNQSKNSTSTDIYEVFLNQMKKILKNNKIIQTGKKQIINPQTGKQTYPLSLIIHNPEQLKQNLQIYWDTIQKISLKSTTIDKRHEYKYYCSSLWKNATSFDFSHPEEFIQRYTSFILDQTFSSLDNFTYLGKFSDCKLYIKRKQAPIGFETPYELEAVLVQNQNVVPFPILRYGISEKERVKTAYIYALQREHYERTELQIALEKKWDIIKKSVSSMQNRGIHTPAFLLMASLFLGLLDSENIKEMCIPDFFPRRYYQIQNTGNDADSIQRTITDKFLKTMIRLAGEFDHLEISGYPGDIDSFLHLKIKGPLFSKNKYLQDIFTCGKTYQTGKPKILKKTGI